MNIVIKGLLSILVGVSVATANTQAPSASLNELIIPESIGSQYISEKYVPYPKPRRTVPPAWTLDSCVNYVKWLLDYHLPMGRAGDIIPNSELKDEGIVLLDEGNWGHVAHYIRQGNELVLDETNYEPGKYTTGRRISIDYLRIRGYWQPLFSL